MAHISIVVGNGDSDVYIDGLCYKNLDLSSCGLPSNLWALQWNENGETNTGHIEYVGSNVPNQEITELPSWAVACVAKWQAKKDADDQAAAEAAAIAAANESTTSV